MFVLANFLCLCFLEVNVYNGLNITITIDEIRSWSSKFECVVSIKGRLLKTVCFSANNIKSFFVDYVVAIIAENFKLFYLIQFVWIHFEILSAITSFGIFFIFSKSHCLILSSHSQSRISLRKTEKRNTEANSGFGADINVFIGARYAVQENKWKWSDGSAANFSEPASSTCRQKVLHYGLGWELLNKNCSDQAYYACQYESRFSLKVSAFVLFSTCYAKNRSNVLLAS